jgi:hypothetical protein
MFWAGEKVGPAAAPATALPNALTPSRRDMLVVIDCSNLSRRTTDYTAN